MDSGYGSWSATEVQEGEKGEEEDMEISSKRKLNLNLNNNVRTTVFTFTLAFDKRMFLCVVSAPLPLISASQTSTIVLIQPPLLSCFRRTLKPVHVATCRIIFRSDNMAAVRFLKVRMVLAFGTRFSSFVSLQILPAAPWPWGWLSL
jgi:hypothetical protein